MLQRSQRRGPSHHPLDSAEHLADTVKRYVKVYNQHIPQKALGHIPPLQAMKYWSQKQTQLFKKCVYNLSGLDIPSAVTGYQNTKPTEE